MTWAVPTITGIQRTTVIVMLAASVLVDGLISPEAAIGCLTGGIVMIANLYLLAIVGKTVIAMARCGSVVKFGAIIAPIKMLLLAAVAGWLILRLRIDPIGFCIGVFTQFMAIFIETGRVSIRSTPASAEGQKA